MLLLPKKLYKYLTSDGAQKLFSSDQPAIWFRFSNRLNDVYDLRPIGSYMDEFASIAVFCLSETPYSSPMWAHYGSNGEGVVLEFSLQSLFFLENPPVKVCYSSKRPTVKNTMKALTTKNAEWSYEREWRCFKGLPSTRADGDIFLLAEQAVSVPFPFEALTAIIHGHDSRVSAENFLARSEAKHVAQLICRTKAREYGFNVRPFNDLAHIFENQDAALWGRKQQRK
jgi:hypothetical protein